MTRKTPFKHEVNKHTRSSPRGKLVHVGEYKRGKGKPSAHKSIKNLVPKREFTITREWLSKIHKGRTPTAQSIDNSLRAPIAKNNSQWIHAPNEYDVLGIDTPGDNLKGARLPISGLTNAQINMNQIGGYYRVDVWDKEGNRVPDKYGFKDKTEAELFVKRVKEANKEDKPPLSKAAMQAFTELHAHIKETHEGDKGDKESKQSPSFRTWGDMKYALHDTISGSRSKVRADELAEQLRRLGANARVIVSAYDNNVFLVYATPTAAPKDEVKDSAKTVIKGMKKFVLRDDGSIEIYWGAKRVRDRPELEAEAQEIFKYELRVKGEKVNPDTIPSLKPASPALLSKYKQVFKSENDEARSGIIMDKDHVSGVVVDPSAASKMFLNRTDTEKHDYDYVSLDALKDAGAHIAIGGSTYTTSIIINTLKALGKKDITFYTAKDSILIVKSKNGEAIAIAPCIGVDDEQQFTGIPKLKDVNLTERQEKQERASKKVAIKDKKDAIGKTLDLLEQKGKTAGNLRAINYDDVEKGRDHIVKKLYNEAKKYPTSHPLEEAAVFLFDRFEASDLDPSGKDVVAYKKEPPTWWTQSEGAGVDSGKKVIPYKKYHELWTNREAIKEQEKQIKQRRFRAISKGYKTLEDKAEELRKEVNKITYAVPMDLPPDHPKVQATMKEMHRKDKQIRAIRDKMQQLEYREKGRYWLLEEAKNAGPMKVSTSKSKQEDAIIDQIQNKKPHLTKAAIHALIKEERAKAANLLSEEAAAHLVASNLGISISTTKEAKR